MPSSNQPAKERLQYGGQAVVEGVMMRSPRFFAVACRRESDGEIVVDCENVESVTKRLQWLNKPFLRGILALIDSLYMGSKALMYSANLQMLDQEASAKKTTASLDAPVSEDDKNLEDSQSAPPDSGPTQKSSSTSSAQPINSVVIGGTVFLSLAIGMALFWVIPTFITDGVKALAHIRSHTALANFYSNLSDGMIRIAIFLAYVGLISRMENIRRVFQYHGAEHKAINTFESGLELTLENARKSSRIHPRCGTNFIFIVLIVSIFVFAFLGRPPLYIRVPLHLMIVPIIVGVSYEFLKLMGRFGNRAWAKALIAPGLATQYLTTRPPDDSMIEVALAALKQVWEKEHEEEESKS